MFDMASLMQMLAARRGMPGAFPAAVPPGMGNEPTQEELAAASQPAMIGSQPQMGILGGMGSPFARGATPMLAPPAGIAGMFGSASQPGQPQQAVTSLDGGPIPLPRPDPRRTTEMGSRNVSTQAPGAPLSLAPPMMDQPAQAPAAPAGGGFRMPSSAFLLALGGGMAGAPSFGQAMRRGFSNAAGVAAQDDARSSAQSLQATNQNMVIRSLQQAGAKPNEIMAALASKDGLDAVNKKYFGTDPNLPAGYRKKADGSGLEFIPGGPADPVVKRTLTDRQNAPQGYRWADPADESKGLIAIPGGPAEKITTEVAARIGMADSFLGQLPAIRKTLTEGGATGPIDAFMAKIGQGRAGEVRRQIESGSEALLRNLTGAGMGLNEAKEYAGRYRLQPWDTVESITSKMNQLERELQFVKATVQRGRSTTPTVSNGKLVFGDMEAPSSTAAPARVGKTKSGLSFQLIED